MEPSRPGALPVSEPRRFPVGAVVGGLVLAVIATWITVAVATHRDPEEVVEDYLTAVAEKDVEGALELVTRFGYGVPYGDEAVFLTPEAISDDWWVVSTEEIDREYRTARVSAVIAGPGGTAEGEFTVHEEDDEWMMVDPFVQVQFPSSPLSYIQVNDKIVAQSSDRPYYQRPYTLFPGPYRFYQSVQDVVGVRKTEVVAAFPPPEHVSGRDESVIVPPALTAGKDTVAKARKAMARRIDECVGFATQVPAGDCPFGTDGAIDTTDGRRVTELHGLKWTVQSHPVIELADRRTEDASGGFTVTATEPGTVALTGSGRDTKGNAVTFTVTCDIDLTGVTAKVDADGAVTLSQAPRLENNFNTCRRNV